MVLWAYSSAHGAKGPGIESPWRQEFILKCMFCDFEKIKLRLGPTFKKKKKLFVTSYYFCTSGDEQDYHEVEEIIPHPEYDFAGQNMDYCLVKLASPGVKLSPKVGIACLPKDVTRTYSNDELTVIGWGTTEPGGVQSEGTQ